MPMLADADANRCLLAATAGSLAATRLGGGLRTCGRWAAGGAAIVLAHDLAGGWARRRLARLPVHPTRLLELSVTRVEWLAASSAALLSAGTLAAGVRLIGTRPSLALPFFAMP